MGLAPPSTLKLYFATSHKRRECLQGAPKGEEDEAPTGRSLTCPHCGREFNRPGGLGKHLKSCGPQANPPDALSCPKCHRTFRQPSGLAAHSKSCKAGRQPESDGACGTPLQSFNTEPTSNEIICPRCDRTFRSRGGLGNHLRFCRGAEEKQDHDAGHHCPFCNKSCRSKGGLTNHIHRMHKDTTPDSNRPSTPSDTFRTSPRQCSQGSPCKTPEPAISTPATGQHSPHSTGGSDHCSVGASPVVENTHSPAAPPENLEESYSFLPRLQIPPANAAKLWAQADETIDLCLKQSHPSFNKLPADEMLSVLTEAIRFYFPSSQTAGRHLNNNKTESRADQLKHLRKRKRQLRREWRNRCMEPTESTAALRSEFHAVHKRIKRLSAQLAKVENEACRTENMRRFRADPFTFGKNFFSDHAQSRPDFSVEEALSHFATTYTDDDRSAGYSPFEKDPTKPEPSVSFPTSLPSRSLFQSNLKKTRNSSAPGPNRIPYLVWKKCPSLQQRLYTVCCKVWKQAQIPSSWRQAIIVLVHKKGDQKNPANFRPIALSNCDSKIFFSLVASVTTTYMRSNNYFDGLTQKGFLPKMSGCVEHASLSWEALRDAKENHRSICFAWLDLKNAFGSIRHMLVQHCLKLYHFPAHFCNLVFSYYDMMTAKISIGNDLSDPFQFAIGVFQGCVLSPVLFNICIQPLLDTLHTFATGKGWSYTFAQNANISRDVSAYADDIELCTWNPPACQTLLDLADGYLIWSRSLVARPEKCFATAMRLKNTSAHSSGHYRPFDPQLTITGQPLQYLDDGNFKYLGRPLNTQLSEDTCRKDIKATLVALLEKLNNAALPSTAKLWLYHHFCTTKLSWFLLINDLTLTFVKDLQATALKYLKSWSGLPRCANSALLFVGDRSRFGLRVRNLETLWKQQQNVKLSLLRSSNDDRCKAVLELICQRQGSWAKKFAPAVLSQCAQAVVEANSSPPPAQLSLGPESAPPRLEPRSVRRRANAYIKDLDVGSQLEHLGSLQMQGRWLEWSQRMHMDLNWNQLIYNWSDAELRFALQAVSDTAPTPTNLHRWGCREVDPSCVLCGRPCTLRHLLNACSRALDQGRFKWRHDSVLAIIKKHLTAFWAADATQKAVQSQSRGQRYITFVPAGHSAAVASHSSSRRPLTTQNILLQASDWDFLFDLGSERLQFPTEIAATSLRPDGVIFSRSQKIVVLLELTVPLEDRCDIAHERKSKHYKKLARTCRENGFTTHLFPVEVGCLGFCPHTFLTCFEALGLPKSSARKLRTECARVALRCSYFLYLRRGISHWDTGQSVLA